MGLLRSFRPRRAVSDLRFRYRTHEFEGLDIHVRTLRDTQEYCSDDDAEALGISSAQWPLFGVVWDAGLSLATMMVEEDIEGRRILEVGCGIGLASLVLNEREADITATEQHPRAEGFLEHNTSINGGRSIPFTRTGWVDDEDGMGRFDLIIGSDLLYGRDHAEALSAFILRHALPSCEVLLIDGGRGHVPRFQAALESGGFTCTSREATTGKGRALRFLR